MINLLSISELKNYCIENNIAFFPCDKTEITELIQTIPNISPLLLEFYQEIGKISSTELVIFSPNELIAKYNKSNDDDFIDLFHEYCGMLNVETKKQELSKKEPIMFLSGEVVFMHFEDWEFGDPYPNGFTNEDVYIEIEDDEINEIYLVVHKYYKIKKLDGLLFALNLHIKGFSIAKWRY